MIKRIVAALIVAAVLSPCLSAAADERDCVSELVSASGLDGLESDMLEDGELTGERKVNIFEKAFAILKAAVTGDGAVMTAKAGLLLAALLLSALTSALKFGSAELDRAGSCVTLGAVSAAAYAMMSDLYAVVNASLSALCTAVTALMPVTASLYAAGGNTAAAAASNAGLLLFLDAVTIICSKVLLPLFGINFALSLAGAMPMSFDLAPVASAVRSAATTLMSFVFAMLGFTLYIQTSIAAAGDGYFSRSVRFASGVLVPVIGNILGDAYRTVAASVSVVKGAAGAAGTVMILAAVIPPIAVTAIYRLLTSVCAAAAKSLGCEGESKLLNGLSGLAGTLFALTVGAGAVCLIAVAVFLKTTAAA